MDLIESVNPALFRHPWETARFWFFERRILRRPALYMKTRLLDVGAGDAWFSSNLLERHPSAFDITCLDVNYTNQHLAAPPQGIRLLRELPESETFDLILLLDVLEHVKDDNSFLQSLANRLTPGGTLLISVPAWQYLFSSHDRSLGHHRRYALSSLRRIAAEVDLTVLESGGLFASLLIPRSIAIALERVMNINRPFKGAQWERGPWISGILHAALVADAWIGELCARVRIPFPGLSWWVECTKP